MNYASSVIIAVLVYTAIEPCGAHPDQNGNGKIFESVNETVPADSQVYVPIPEEDDGNSIDYPGNVSASNTRVKRKLQMNVFTRKVILFLYDKDKNIKEEATDLVWSSNPNNMKFKVHDFIIRLQEKYEYTICDQYLDSVPELRNTYFQFDEDIVNVPNLQLNKETGAVYYEESKYDDKTLQAKVDRFEETQDKRYGLYSEPCDLEVGKVLRFKRHFTRKGTQPICRYPFIMPNIHYITQQEWNFWRDMFLAAENDTIPVKKDRDPGNPPGRPGSGNPFDANLDEYDYVQIEPREMMQKWNDIWVQYQLRQVCNQRLLLECHANEQYNASDPNDFPAYCGCRKYGIGLPSVVSQVPDTAWLDFIFEDESNTFVDQYHEDLQKDVFGKVVTHPGKFVHKQKCVISASVNFVPVEANIINPCDFFLPMIGLCSAECHFNASCRSVNEIEKEAMMKISEKMDFITRVKDKKLREVYHQKCVCNPGKSCRSDDKRWTSKATTFKPQKQNIFKLIMAIFLVYKSLCFA